MKNPVDLSPEPTPVVAYARVSQIREEMISPEIQLESIRQWAASRNRVVVAEIVDPNATGRNFDRKVQDAITLVEQGGAREIVVYKFSRFGRSRRGWELNLGRLQDVGGELQSSTEEVDASTATGKLTRGMLKEIAAFESDRFSDQWQDAQAYRLSLGLPHTATPRFGYVHHKCGAQAVTSAGWRIRNAKDPICRTPDCREEFRIDPITGPILASMYAAYISGKSLAAIAAWCIQQGVPSVAGGTWRSTTVAGVLDSGFGAGLLQIGVNRGKPTATQRWVPGAQKPVISEADWHRYRARRARVRGDATTSRTRWPLSGISRCGLCGGPMTCTTGGPNGRQIRGYILRCTQAQDNRSCPGVWRVTHEVEQALFTALDRLASEIERRKRGLVATLKPNRGDRESQRQRLRAELRAIGTKRSNLVNAVAEGVLAFDDVRAKRDELDEQAKRVNEALLQFTAPKEVWTPPRLRSVRLDWGRIPVETRREMVRTVVDTIVCHPDKTITVTLAEDIL